jgi:hypothetical protein
MHQVFLVKVNKTSGYFLIHNLVFISGILNQFKNGNKEQYYCHWI